MCLHIEDWDRRDRNRPFNKSEIYLLQYHCCVICLGATQILYRVSKGYT